VKIHQAVSKLRELSPAWHKYKSAAALGAPKT
jgi:hypothetical protein